MLGRLVRPWAWAQGRCPRMVRVFTGQNDNLPDLPSTPATTQALVDPLPTAQWSADHVNSVTLIGTVLSTPILNAIPGNQMVTNVQLGLRQRFSRSASNQTVPLEAWGYTSLQIAQHVKPGMQVFLQLQWLLS